MADSELLRELNRDIWHAFVRAYGARDVTAFLAVHSPDLIRAGGPEKQPHGYAEYAAQTGQWFADLTERGDDIAIEFRFDERIASGDLASERGVYRITATPAAGEQLVFYGRFHTFSRRTGDGWRIAVDYDSNEGGTLTEETFASGADIDDVGRFTG